MPAMARAMVDGVALAGSPAQWAVLAVVVVAVLAPRMLPPLARFGSRLLARELRRRLGLPAEERRRARGPRPSEPEVLPPSRPRPTLRRSNVPLAPESGPARVRSIWPVVALFAVAIAGLLWALLHAR